MILEQRPDAGVAGGRLDIQLGILSGNLPWKVLSIRYPPFRSGQTREAVDRQESSLIFGVQFPLCKIHTTFSPPQLNAETLQSERV